MNTKPTNALFLRRLIMHKKKIVLLVIFALLVPGFSPYGFNNSNKTIKNNRISHAQMCCCNKAVSTCRDCCCSEDLAETDNTGKDTVTITACGGTSDDVITVSKPYYVFSLSVVINYLPVTISIDTTTPQPKDVLQKPPYKPPESPLLTIFT